jgi:hypothetical protein
MAKPCFDRMMNDLAASGPLPASMLTCSVYRYLDPSQSSLPAQVNAPPDAKCRSLRGDNPGRHFVRRNSAWLDMV